MLNKKKCDLKKNLFFRCYHIFEDTIISIAGQGNSL